VAGLEERAGFDSSSASSPLRMKLMHLLMKSSTSTSCEPSPKAAFFAFLDARTAALTRNHESMDLTYIRKAEFFSSSPPHAATRSAATGFIM
jgi:hypothetical protein